MWYGLCAQSFLMYGTQVWYPFTVYRQKLELFNKKRFFGFTGLPNCSQQLPIWNTLPMSCHLIVYDIVFLNKAMNNKYDSNLSTYICFSNCGNNLGSSKHQKLLPVKKMSQTLHERVLLWKSLWLLQFPRYKRDWRFRQLKK